MTTEQRAANAILDALTKNEHPINYANLIRHDFPDELRAASEALMTDYKANPAQHRGAPVAADVLVALADRAAYYLHLSHEVHEAAQPQQCAALTHAGRRCLNTVYDHRSPFCTVHRRLRADPGGQVPNL